MVLRLVWSLALCLVVAPASAAAAAPVPEDSSTPAGERVLVAPPGLRGIVGAQAQEAIRGALQAGLSRAGLAVVEPPAGPPCSDDACLVAAARSLAAAHVVVLQVTAVDRDYSVQAALIDVATGARREIREACTICGLEQATTIVESFGPRLAMLAEQQRRVAAQAQALREQPRLRVTSSPAGATVLVDGEAIGRTPVEHLVPTGRHVVEVRLRRYVRERREVEALRGTASEIAVPLRREGRLPPSPRSRALLISGSALIGAGALGLGVMTLGLARGADAERDGAARLAALQAMGVGGLELTDALADVRARGERADAVALAGAVTGGALLVTGVTLAVVSTTNAARRVVVTPWGARGSAGLSLVGRF